MKEKKHVHTSAAYSIPIYFGIRFSAVTVWRINTSKSFNHNLTNEIFSVTLYVFNQGGSIIN
jgi:hypothetical protein